MAKCIPFRFRQQSYIFTRRIGFLLLCLFFFSVFCLLGIWQLQRYHYKKSLLFSYQQRLTAAPIAFTKATALENTQFLQVSAQGTYENKWTLFIQNQPYHNQLGFEVLTPLRIPGHTKLLLVDRGWVQQPTTATTPILEKQQINGYIKWINEYHFILGKNILDPTVLPLIMQKIDIDEISRITHQSFYPYILRLHPNAPHGFVRDWTITTSLPQRHLGYAIQWFAMALVLLIAYFCFSFERIEE